MIRNSKVSILVAVVAAQVLVAICLGVFIVIDNHNRQSANTSKSGETIVVNPLDVSAGYVVEMFNIEGDVVPGMVVSIHRQKVFWLSPSSTSYDTSVAGVVAGAGGRQPGIILRMSGVEGGDGSHAVGIFGRMFVLCDARYGEIQPGDLLTTSETVGHAMKFEESKSACGAVIGKALSRLPTGTGLVDVLLMRQ